MADKMTEINSPKKVEGCCVGDEAESRNVLCVVGSDLKDDANLLDSFKALDVDIKFSTNGDELIREVDESSLQNVGFVVSNFDDEIFQKLRKVTARIFGPPAILHYAQKKEVLIASRPLFCTSMNKVIVCFSGFKKKEELQKLVDLVHHMGGSVRKDFSTSVTHLVANVTSSEKYHYAVSLGKPVMVPEWILKSWENNSDSSFSILNLPLSQYKLKPFVSCLITFVGFPIEEKQHMEELAIANGGGICSAEDPMVTHIVLEEEKCIDPPVSSSCDGRVVFLVKAEWFWASIQMDVQADEAIYQAKLVGESESSSGDTPSSYLTPNSRAARKRKRLKDTLGHLANHSDIESASPTLGGGLSGTKQRRSAENTLSPSILDITISPQLVEGAQGRDWRTECVTTVSSNINTMRTPYDLKAMSPRHQVCYELLQTETNYVGILHTIITLIKEPIEDVSQMGGSLLEPTDVKIIFGNLQPIYEVHRQLRDDLSNLINTWNDDNSVGKIILKYSQDLLKAYPPFINFFEKTKETLLECDATKPRFHAFLKICRNKPECGRQSLVELLIRPVQRLPSVVLLLNDIMKHTPKSNSDSEALDEAIKCLKEIMTHINEDKRKTEGQVAMFVIVNDIENCPANLLSSHRNFVVKADMIELGDELSGKGVHLTMFLFTDMLEICKRRKCASFVSSAPTGISSGSSGASLSMRSPSVMSLHYVKAARKSYKHIELLPLSHIKRVVDIKETEGYHNVFALVCRSNHQIRERLYTFALLTRDDEDDSEEKLTFLRILCRHLANAVCRPDAESFLKSLEPHHLGISGSDIGTSTLSKAAVRIASKTSRKVSRAFSFTKSPHKLTRAISTMMSPRPKDSPYGSPEFNSPLVSASKRFPCASALNLQDLESRSQTLSSTPGIGKKLKSFTIGSSTSVLKRL